MSNKSPYSNRNTIVGGFIDGGNSSSSRQKYAWQVLVANVMSSRTPRGELGKIRVNITFSDNDVVGTISQDNDPLIITVQHGNWDIK